jgi:NAD(P)-dependent dehydrogenase (short-subunit alcohol dehydrogenase family)
VVEVGPGYGRILSTLLQREIPFGTYCGIEISATRVARLRQQFIDKRVQFECGDINSYRSHQPADVVISSATFVHLYPDCLNALKNIRSQISPTALIAIDFIDPTHYSTSRGFDSASGTYVVGYTRDELREIFSAAGYDVIAMPEFVIGLGAAGDVFGLLVIARPVVHNSLPTNVVGHRIVLTGVSQGIGEAMARQCLDAGWTVEAIGRSRPPWPDRDRFSFHLADLRNLDEVNFALSKIRGPIDVLVNNAAAAGWNSQTFRDFSPEDFQETFQVNTVVPIYIARRLEEQLSLGAQKLVVMVSTANASISSNSTPNMLAYKSSKSALNQAVRTIAAEWVGSDKTVVALSPGWARTAMGGESAPLSPDEAAAQILRFIFNNLWVGRSGLFISIDGSPQPW